MICRRRLGAPWRALLNPCALALTVLAAAAPAALADPPAVFNPVVEAQNFSITQQRQAIYDTPAYQAALAADGTASAAQALAAQAGDPQRFFTDDLCWNASERLRRRHPPQRLGRPRLRAGAAGAVHGPRRGHPVRPRVGHGGRARRTARPWSSPTARCRPTSRCTGSSPRPWPRPGYVVLTFDPQGQGQSDTFGAGADRTEGVPAQSDGRPFYDGTEDAIDFMLSTPAHPYAPRAQLQYRHQPCRQAGRPRQSRPRRRLQPVLEPARPEPARTRRPFLRRRRRLLRRPVGSPRARRGGAGQPRRPGPQAGAAVGSGSGGSGALGEQPLPGRSGGARDRVPITKPGLGISADYGLPPTPNTSLPDPAFKAQESYAYSRAGVDSGEIVIRGGSHLDFSFIPNQAFGASLRGPDITDWYTTAWFDRYLKGDPGAMARLLTERWRDDPVEAGVDPNHDGNAFSFYYHSRLDIALTGGGRFDCEELRDGCPGMSSPTATPADYSYVADRHHSGRRARHRRRPAPGVSGLTSCPARSATRLRLLALGHRPPRSYASTSTTGWCSHGAAGGCARSLLPGLPGTARHRVPVRESARARPAADRCAAPCAGAPADGMGKDVR